MCDCIEQVNKDLAARGLDIRVKENIGISKGMDLTGPFASVERERKDGGKPRKKDPIISAQYCPFCGERYGAEKK